MTEERTRNTIKRGREAALYCPSVEEPMSNELFRFYARSPEAVFEPLRRHWRSAVVRCDARKIGPHDWWLVVVVLDDPVAGAWFRRWLDGYGRRGDLRLGDRGKGPFIISDAIFVRKRLPIWRWLARKLPLAPRRTRRLE